MLTLNEKKLIADALNGCGLLIQCNPNYIHQMMGDNGALKNAAIIGTDQDGRVLLRGSTVCSGLEHEIYDAIRLNRLDEKWAVNGADLIHKIREMTPAQREAIVRLMGALWADTEHLNDGSFERRLEQFTIES